MIYAKRISFLAFTLGFTIAFTQLSAVAQEAPKMRLPFESQKASVMREYSDSFKGDGGRPATTAGQLGILDLRRGTQETF